MSEIIAVHFNIIDPNFNTSQKRLNFIRKLGVEPIKKQHKTSTQYRYRIKNADSNKKHFTRKKNGVNIIYEGERIKAGSILDVIKNPIKTLKQVVYGIDDFNYMSKETLEKYGNNKIIGINIARTPLSKLINGALDNLSLGRFNELTKQEGYDKLYHLSLILKLDDDTEIIYEKNETVDIQPLNKSKSLNNTTQYLTIENVYKSLNDFVNDAINFIGRKEYFIYRGFSLNCQHFILNSLRANNVYLSKETEDFIYQDFSNIRENLNNSQFSYLEKVMNTVTDLGQKTSLIMGKGLTQNMSKELEEHIDKSAKELHQIIIDGNFKCF